MTASECVIASTIAEYMCQQDDPDWRAAAVEEWYDRLVGTPAVVKGWEDLARDQTEEVLQQKIERSLNAIQGYGSNPTKYNLLNIERHNGYIRDLEAELELLQTLRTETGEPDYHAIEMARLRRACDESRNYMIEPFSNFENFVEKHYGGWETYIADMQKEKFSFFHLSTIQYSMPMANLRIAVILHQNDIGGFVSEYGQNLIAGKIDGVVREANPHQESNRWSFSPAGPVARDVSIHADPAKGFNVFGPRAGRFNCQPYSEDDFNQTGANYNVNITFGSNVGAYDEWAKVKPHLDYLKTQNVSFVLTDKSGAIHSYHLVRPRPIVPTPAAMPTPNRPPQP